MDKIKVLIIDDSVLIRALLTSVLEMSDDIEVIGTAEDPIIARSKIKKFRPDVLTLDIEMPRMDGITFLRNLMRLRPMPVIMISTLTAKGAQITLDSLEIGALDFIEKPKSDIITGFNVYANDLIDKVKAVSKVNFMSTVSQNSLEHNLNKIANTTPQKHLMLNREKFSKSQCIIALGSSTGGTEAIKSVVRKLDKTTPAILITQHLPIAFSESFVKHVDCVTEMNVYLAEEGQKIKQGSVYIAPGNRHLEVIKKGSDYYCQLLDTELVNRHKPSVEVMFESVAKNVEEKVIGIMLTGMGSDGAMAMKKMRDSGAINIVQDEDSSVVWGMPKAAYEVGAADYVEPLDNIANKIQDLLKY